MKKLLSIILTAAIFSVMAFSAVTTAFAKGSQDSTPKNGDTVAVLHTNYGDIAMYFFPEEAPKGVENFQTLAKDGKYDNTIFHRVIENFMIQGGDYTNSDGTGGESCWGKDFDLECVDYLSNTRGAVAYANRGPGTNSSQFYINSADNSASLDGSYTVFAQVYSGMDVVDLISKCEKSLSSNGEQSIPVNQVKLESVDIEKYKKGMENSLAAATDPYEGVESTSAQDNDNDANSANSSDNSQEEDDDEPFNFIPIIVTVGVLAIIFACFAIPYGISDRKKKKAKAAAKAAKKASPDYKKKKSTKKRK